MELTERSTQISISMLLKTYHKIYRRSTFFIAYTTEIEQIKFY